MQKRETRILVVDDHPVFREGLRYAFSEKPDLKVVAEAVNGREMLEKVQEYEIDLVLLDVTMENESSLSYMKEVRNKKPDVPILVISVYPENHFATRYINAGASGYITKERPLDELLSAIRKVASGSKYLKADILENIVFCSSETYKTGHQSLSNREFEIFLLLVSGEPLILIAQKLCLSVKTISSHRSNILRKMNMKSNAQLIQYAIKNMLI